VAKSKKASISCSQLTSTRSTLSCVRNKTPKYLYELADAVDYINELDLAPHFHGNLKKYNVTVQSSQNANVILRDAIWSVTGSLINESDAEVYNIYSHHSDRTINIVPVEGASNYLYYLTPRDPRIVVKYIEKHRNISLKVSDKK
jgi:hypothetical protein